ncbi:Krueppel homolog 1-like [Centruroides sculpturatus]|uniref:Krueppel homolog 1-like n=1 Tax=Centruroides sculpturatus TaxID=218467 RepID=UPI000C6E8E00|nr:Krueppel homolog 1-like [Centruroides sculpturatus]
MEFQCLICEMTFSEESSYIHHQQTHAEDRHECQRCGQEFFRLQDLQLHERTEHEARLFVCEICNATFEQEETFVIHQEQHQIEQHHLQIEQDKNKHASEQPHRCLDCKQMFDSEVELQKHGEEKHGSEPFHYQCRYCKKLFADREMYKSHFREHSSRSVLQELLMREEPSLPQNFPELQSKPGSSAQTLQEQAMQASPLTHIVETPRMQTRPSSIQTLQKRRMHSGPSSTQIVKKPRGQTGPSSTQTLQKPPIQATPSAQIEQAPLMQAGPSSALTLQKPQIQATPSSQIVEAPWMQAGPSSTLTLQKQRTQTGPSSTQTFIESRTQTEPSSMQTVIEPRMQAKPLLTQTLDEPKIEAEASSTQSLEKLSMQVEPSLSALLQEFLMQAGYNIATILQELFMVTGSSLIAMLQEQLMQTSPSTIETLIKAGMQAGPSTQNLQGRQMQEEFTTQTLHSFHDSAQTSNKEKIQARPFSTEISEETMMQVSSSTEFSQVIEPFTEILPTFHDSSLFSSTQMSDKKGKQFPPAQILPEDWMQAGPSFINISEKGVIQEESFSSETSEKVLMHAESSTETVTSFHDSSSTETSNKEDMQARSFTQTPSDEQKNENESV